MRTKITLGTANFGLTYGIANNRMLSEREALQILETGSRLGLSSVDTARGYGNAEKILGTFFRVHGKIFEVVTKLPPGEYKSPHDVAREIETSLNNIGADYIDVLLLHSFDTFQRCRDVVIPALETYVRKRTVGRFGISVYHPWEAEVTVEYLSGLGARLGAVQFPLNVFDRRFLKDDLLNRLKLMGTRCDARSAFLQGLFFLDPGKLTAQFDPAREKLKTLATIAEEHRFSIGALALLFAVSCGVDHVVLGVDSAKQLEMNLGWLGNGNFDRFAGISDCLDTLEVQAEEVILPYRWQTRIEK